jgi:hypothetical protein
MTSRYEAYFRSFPGSSRKNADPPAAQPGGRPARGACPAVLRQPSVLETLHPEIARAVTLLWGYPEMNLYFEKLWLDDGGGKPIAPEAMSELMLLAGVHRWLLPHCPARSMASIYDVSGEPKRRKDIWRDVSRRR